MGSTNPDGIEVHEGHILVSEQATVDDKDLRWTRTGSRDHVSTPTTSRYRSVHQGGNGEQFETALKRAVQLVAVRGHAVVLEKYLLQETLRGRSIVKSQGVAHKQCWRARTQHPLRPRL